MRRRVVRRAFPSLSVIAALVAVGSPTPAFGGSGYHPHAAKRDAIRRVDLSAEANAARRQSLRAAQQRQASHSERSFESLDALALDPPPPVARSGAASLPEGWVQRGSVVLPAAVANGEIQVDPDVAFAVEDIPGNKYPRKHTLYLNFVGADLLGGFDNSAENRSALALAGPYPAYLGGNQKALSIAQAVAEDLEGYGVQVVYLPEDRPSKTVPYTMEMVGGTWQDTNIDSPAGGVAPGADCGALGQRHVVYTFAGAGLGVNTAANTASQEAGHAWGLDHTFNCSSVMSYCGVANGNFSDSCDQLCESQCQGPNSAGCRLTHEMFCGEDNDEQNEAATLNWLFGGNEPDIEPPTVNIVEPLDGSEFEVGADVDLRTELDDDYGGFGWKYTFTVNGEVVFDEVDYDRQIDDDFRGALNLANLEEGEWTVTVEAEDHFDHVTTQTVSFVVGDPQPMVADGETGPDGGSDSTDGETVDGMADGTGDGDDGGGKGICACRTDRRGSDAPWLLFGFLTIAATVRRRQRS